MANTQVFSLGVTVAPWLGSALVALRRQADGVRLGRLIGEVIRLGLELDKVRLAERALALEQADPHEQHILRLERELDLVARLRVGYLGLMRVGDTSRPAPAPASAEKAQARTSRDVRGKAARGLAIAAGATVLGLLGYEAHRSQGPNGRRRVGRALRKSWKANAGEARDDALEALLSGETGEKKAEGVGSALGKLGGSMAGAALSTRLRNRRLKRLLPAFGGVLGKVFGGQGAGALYNWIEYEDEAKPGDAKAATDPAKQLAQATQAAPRQAPAPATQQAQASGPAEGALGMLATAVEAAPGRGRAAASGAGKLFNASKGVFKRIPALSVLATGAELAEIHNSKAAPEQKREAYATAVGGFGGGLAGAAAGAALGSVVPVIGTAIGGLIGGVLGSMAGEQVGGALGKVLNPRATELTKSPAGEVTVSPAAPVVSAQAAAVQAAPPALNQQFTFTANMPVTFSNSLSDPGVLQQLEAMARRQLEDLMRQARPAQLLDPPHIAL